MPSSLEFFLHHLPKTKPERSIALCIFKLFGNLLPKGEKCIDHRLRERVFCLLSLLFLVEPFLCTWLIHYVFVRVRYLFDHGVSSYATLMLAWMILSLISHIWSFTLLGDKCMLLISIILSAPPRCMWHGRVTHDPNRLCICIQKQILNNCTNLGGALSYHILLKATMYFKSYYHLSKLWSICCHQLPKRGRLKVQLSLGGFGNS